MSVSWSIPNKTFIIERMPLLMGIVNVTPDSFSDGGQYHTVESAVQHGLGLVEQGADILDIGGESTRPGAAPVSIAEELRRVVPVIEQLRKKVPLPLSVDTSKAAVAREAIAAGAGIINDVTGLTGDPEMLAVAAESQAGIIAMHMQGTPQTMQINPRYDDVVQEVHDYLQLRLAELQKAGIAPERIAVDPGIGFGKRLEHNVQMLGRLDRLAGHNRPICLGVSRKGFINRLLGRTGNVEHGDYGTIGVCTFALSRHWIHIARVHNVKAFHDAAKLFLALEEAADTR
jgi:dihydropteroate synthase